MIHINTGPDESKHEWLTTEEYEEKYGKISGPGPHIQEGKALMEIRVKKKVTMIDLAEKMKVSVVWLSHLERGRIEVTPEIVKNWALSLIQAYTK